MGDQRWNRWERRCKEAFLLPVPVPSDSIAGPPEPFLKVKSNIDKTKKTGKMILPVFFIIYKLKSSINYKLSTINYHLVPLYSVGITTSLVVFQRICQGGCVTTEGEVVARIWSENHRTAHVETV